MSEKIKKEIKAFVLDTNVFIHRPDAVKSFKNSEIVIPLWVLEELDNMKKFSDEKSRNARESIRFLDSLSKHGNLIEGVKLDNNSILRVYTKLEKKMPPGLNVDKVDNKIILAALSLQDEGKKVFFVSKDINARVKATSLGIKAVDYEKQKVNFSELYSGCIEVNLGSEALETFKRSRFIELQENLYPNEFAILKTKDKKALGKYNYQTEETDLIEEEDLSICGISPLNDKQRFALDLLMDDSVSLVSLVGKAGTGKTLLAISAGIQKVIEDKKYKRVLVSRPVIPMGKDIGYLPGSKSEKLSHWMQPLFDNLDFVIEKYKNSAVKSTDYLLNNKFLEVEALTYIRGRSLPEQFIIVDEAQNLSPHEIKTIVSRAGQGSKVVLTGDPYQIDSPYLDSNSNGLTYLVEAFKGQNIFGHIILEKSERSTLAELAAELL